MKEKSQHDQHFQLFNSSKRKVESSSNTIQNWIETSGRQHTFHALLQLTKHKIRSLRQLNKYLSVKYRCCYSIKDGNYT